MSQFGNVDMGLGGSGKVQAPQIPHPHDQAHAENYNVWALWGSEGSKWPPWTYFTYFHLASVKLQLLFCM